MAEPSVLLSRRQPSFRSRRHTLFQALLHEIENGNPFEDKNISSLQKLYASLLLRTMCEARDGRALRMTYPKQLVSLGIATEEECRWDDDDDEEEEEG